MPIAIRRFSPAMSFAAGCLLSAALGWTVRDLRAQSSLLNPVTQIHVCVAADGVIHVVALPAVCPANQTSAFLKRTEADLGDQPDKKDPGPSAADKERLAALDKRIQELEAASKRGELGNKVTAPFEVVDRTGKRIMYVEDRAVHLYNRSSNGVASLIASDTGGTFVARSADSSRVVSVGAGELAGNSNAGMTIAEGAVRRVELGRRGDGSYVGLFTSAGGQRVAGIGQSTEGRGAVYVADTAGAVRASMRMGQDNKPAISVLNAAGNLAMLSEGASGGGKLTLYNAGANTPMVEAGSTADGIGVVRAGPEGFKPGLGVLGLPSSFISGKQ